ncbi:MAG: hypothetical protein ABFD52_05470 [Acidobacteriota bacterium]
MSLSVILGNIVFPILYLIGLIVIYFHQRSKIGNLKGDFDRACALLSVYDPDKIKSFSKMGEEKARLDFEKSQFYEYREKATNEIQASIEKLSGMSVGETRRILVSIGEIKKMEDDLTTLLIQLFYPVSETKYIEKIIGEMPDGKAKTMCQLLLVKMREGNRKEGIGNPLIELAKDEMPVAVALLTHNKEK